MRPPHHRGQAQIIVTFQRARGIRQRRQPRDAVIQSRTVIEVQHLAIGIGHADEPRVIRAARRLAIGILHIRGGARIHRPAMVLVILRHLAEAVDGALHLLDNVTGDDRVMNGDKEGVPGSPEWPGPDLGRISRPGKQIRVAGYRPINLAVIHPPIHVTAFPRAQIEGHPP